MLQVRYFRNGNLARALQRNATNTYLFPIGNNSNYFPLSLVNAQTSSTTDSIVMSAVYSASGTATTTGLALSALNSYYWQMNTINMAANGGLFANVQLTPTGAPLGATDRIGWSTTNTVGSYYTKGATLAIPAITTFVPTLFTTTNLTNYFTVGSAATQVLDCSYEVGNGAPVFQKLNQVANYFSLPEIQIGCATVFELRTDYNGMLFETTSAIQFNAPTYSGGIPFDITIRPKAGVTSVTTGGAAQIVLSGITKLTLDGRAGGTGSTVVWTISNNSTSQSTIRLQNDASNNTIQYLTVKGCNTSTLASPAGVIFIGNGVTTGNDNNIIQYCNVRDSVNGTNYPRHLIYSLNTVNTNDSLKILNNNLFNNFQTGGAMYHSGGCATTVQGHIGVVLHCGNNAAVVSNNSFYQTIARSNVSSIEPCAIFVNTPTGSGHTLSYNFQGGTAPHCGGSPASYTSTNNFVRTPMINFVQSAAANPTVIEGNVITNIQFTSTQNVLGTEFLNTILVRGGNVRIKNNYIGDASLVGISGGIAIVRDAVPDTAGSSIIRGVRITQDITTTIVDSIVGNVMGNISFTGTASGGIRFTGIGVGVGSSSPFVVIAKNSVAGIHSTSASSIRGELIDLFGIRKVRVAGNRLYGISSTGGTPLATDWITGINLSHDAATYGAMAATDTIQFINNMFTLGYGHGQDISMAGIKIDSNVLAPVHIFFNSVMITGTSPGGAVQNTYSFYRGVGVNTPIVLRNNILYNDRIVGGSEGHYAIGTETTPSWDSDYNLLTSETKTPSRQQRGSVGYWTSFFPNLDFSAWKANSGADVNTQGDSPGGITGIMDFLDPENGNLTPVGNNLCDYSVNGIRIGPAGSYGCPNYDYAFYINTDYYDSIRAVNDYDGCYPNIGAVEFNPIGTWQGKISTDWFNPANWCSNTVPDSTISARIIEGPIPPPNFPEIAGGLPASCKNLVLYDNPLVNASGQAPDVGIAGVKLKITTGSTLRIFGNTSYTGGSDNKILQQPNSLIMFTGASSQNIAQIWDTEGYSGYQNVTLAGGGVKTTSNGNVTINQTLNMGGQTLNIGPNDTLTINGTITNPGTFGGATTGQLFLKGTGTVPTTGTLNFTSGTQYRKIWLDRTSSGIANIGTTVSVDTLLISNGTLANGGNNITVKSYAEISASQAHSGSGSLIFTTSDTMGKFVLAGAGTFGNVIINGLNSGNVDTAFIENDISLANLSITSGTFSTLSKSGVQRNLNVTGNWSRNTTNTRFIYGTGTTTFNGTLTQTFTNPDTFYNVVLNNTAGLSLGSPTSNFNVKNTLTLTNGIITTNGGEVFVDNNATGAIVGASTSNYIIGCVRRNINSSTGNYNFPVGKVGAYAPIGINITDALDAPSQTILTCFYNYHPGNTGLPLVGDGGNNYQGVCYGGFWSVNPDNVYGTTAYDVNIDANVYAGCTGTTKTVLKRANNASPWTLEGTRTGPTTRTGLTSFSEFTMGTTDIILPVSFLNFSGYIQNGVAKLLWATTSENHADKFIVQSSTDGVNFSDVGVVLAKGYSTTLTNYNFSDESITGNVVFYRLKQIDFDGTISYSRIITLSSAQQLADKVILSPNPFNEKTYLQLTAAENTLYTLEIQTALGVLVTSRNITVTKGDNIIALDDLASLSHGLYVIKLKSADNVLTIKAIKE
jgi:hypothetical protein